MNPITAKLESLSPTYWPHNAQQHAIRNATDPQAIADSIDDKVREYRELAERHYGPGVFEIDDLLACITLNVPGTIDDEKSNPSRLLSSLPKERVFELGQKSNDYWGGLYRKHIGAVHPEGKAWWEATGERLFVEGIR